MGVTSIQNSSVNCSSENRPCTRSSNDSGLLPDETNATPGSNNSQSLNLKKINTNSLSSSKNLKRTRALSPNKRNCKARKSLNFDSEPVPQTSSSSLSRLRNETKTEDETISQLEGVRNVHVHGSKSSGSVKGEDGCSNVSSTNDSDSLSFSQPRPVSPSNDLTNSSPGFLQNARRSQRITLKKLEEGHTELKDVEAGPGPAVNFNIPLFGVNSQQHCPDQSSDYGTASENSFNICTSQKSLTTFVSPKHAESKLRGRPYRKKHKNKSSPETEVPELCIPSISSPQLLSPGYLSDNEDGYSDDGYLDSDTPTNSQPWDDQDDEEGSNNVNEEEGEWDQLEVLESTQSSVCSDSPSTLNLGKLISAARTRCELLTYRRIHLIIPLEDFELPPITTAVTTRSQHHCDPFGLEESGSKLSKKKKNLSGRPASQFNVQVYSNIDIENSLKQTGLHISVVSPVISLQPFGTKFSSSLPVWVSFPLDVSPSADEEVYCLYSNKPIPTTEGTFTPSDFDWKILCGGSGCNNMTFDNNNDCISFETTEFCYYVIVVREKYYGTSASKQIRARIGGKLVFPFVKGLSVNFPKGSVNEDITASAKIYFDTEMNLTDYFEKGQSLDSNTSALASPILMIEPHGLPFNTPEGITIQLPIPGYDAIMSQFSHLNPKLTIWQSCTSENEECKWELISKPFRVTKVRCGNGQETMISFEVEHFSFFRAVWNIISASLYEARVGMSYFYPYVSFSMKCQANMEENSETNRFGLEVICYASDKPFPEVTTYSYRVGSCNKPKMVKPGKIIIRLKSQFFELDEEAGEDGEEGMVKEECDFRGRDFDVQYALRYKKDMTVGRGTFGKVTVKRVFRAGVEEPLFEFNLQKYGCEGEVTPHGQNDRWSILALQELAGSLFITADDNWKIFAKEIGFTKNEMRTTLKYSADPFIAMLGMFQQRGGTPDEFVNALYSVNRKIKLRGETSPTGSKKSISSQGSSGLGSSAGRFAESDSDTSGTQISQDSLLNGSTRKRSNPSVNRSGGSGSKKTKRTKHMPKTKTKKESSDDETDESGEVSDCSVESESASKIPGAKAMSESTSLLRRSDQTKLGSTFLWELSADLDSLNWRNLARTLCIDEPALLNIEHLHKSSGFRECAYQMLLYWKEKYPKRCIFSVLYNALCKEGMNAVAKKMKFISRND